MKRMAVAVLAALVASSVVSARAADQVEVITVPDAGRTGVEREETAGVEVIRPAPDPRPQRQRTGTGLPTVVVPMAVPRAPAPARRGLPPAEWVGELAEEIEEADDADAEGLRPLRDAQPGSRPGLELPRDLPSLRGPGPAPFGAAAPAGGG